MKIQNLFFVFFVCIHSLVTAMDGGQKQKSPLHLAILVSGEGTNMAALLDTQIQGVKPCIVISSNPDAKALEKARDRGMPTEVVHSKKKNDPEYSPRLIACLKKYGVMPDNGLICLAGFRRILDKPFVNLFKDRILNIHPSLLPKYSGDDAIGQALKAKARVTGCTVHLVDEGVDTGTIVAQSEDIPIDENDTSETLLAKVHAKEHELYPQTVRFIVQSMREGSQIRNLLKVS